MCGITGFSLTNDSCVNGRELMRALLKGIEPRGRDATGFAFFNGETIKADALNVEASKYVKTRRMRLMNPAARVAIGHTRLATQGSYKFRVNNHPVLAYTAEKALVAAVHNGAVWNDDMPFNDFGLPRYGQVDSEAIPAMIAHFGSESFAYTFNYLEGGIATLWMDERDPDVLHAVRAWDSPMVVAHLDTTTSTGKVKGVLIASTVTALTDGLAVLGLSWADEGVRQFEIGEGEYFSVKAGEWDAMVYPFELPEALSRFTSTNWDWYTWRDDGDEDYYEHAGAASVGKAPVTPLPDDLATSEDAYWNDGVDADGDYNPATYDDVAGANAAALAMQDSLDQSEEDYIRWWVTTDGDRILRQIAEECAIPGWQPSFLEIQVISMATDAQIKGADFPEGFIADLVSDPTVHQRHCTRSRCALDIGMMCPVAIAAIDRDAARVAERSADLAEVTS